MKTVLASYGRVLRQASRGGPTPLDLIGAAGGRLARLDAADPVRLVRLRHDGRLSASFWWAAVAIDHVAALGLRVRRVWTSEQRWFAQLD